MATIRNGFGSNSFGARADLSVGGRSYQIFRLDQLPGAARLPYSLKILLENMLRHEDGVTVRPGDIEALVGWDADAEPDTEIAFAPARILMQDFTGVPAVVDLAAMRDAMVEPSGGTRPPSTRSFRPSWSSTTRSSPTCTARPTPSSRTPSSSSSATRSGTGSCAGARAPSTPCGWCRPTPASATRSTWSTWPGWSSPPTPMLTDPARPTRTPSSAPTPTPP